MVAHKCQPWSKDRVHHTDTTITPHAVPQDCMYTSVIFVLINYSVLVLVLVLRSMLTICLNTENTGSIRQLDDVAIGLELAYLHV